MNVKEEDVELVLYKARVGAWFESRMLLDKTYLMVSIAALLALWFKPGIPVLNAFVASCFFTSVGLTLLVFSMNAELMEAHIQDEESAEEISEKVLKVDLYNRVIFSVGASFFLAKMLVC